MFERQQNAQPIEHGEAAGIEEAETEAIEKAKVQSLVTGMLENTTSLPAAITKLVEQAKEFADSESPIHPEYTKQLNEAIHELNHFYHHGMANDAEQLPANSDILTERIQQLCQEKLQSQESTAATIESVAETQKRIIELLDSVSSQSKFNEELTKLAQQQRGNELGTRVSAMHLEFADLALPGETGDTKYVTDDMKEKYLNLPNQ